jgi:hypothetical protein
MRRVIEKAIQGLPLDPRSRSAVDQTLADWAHEASASLSPGRRVLTASQGLQSVARVVSLSLLRETFDFGWCCGLARRWAMVAAVVALLSVIQGIFMFQGDPAMSFLELPLTLLAIAPPALFLMFAWRPAARAVPSAGTAIFLALVMLGLAGWLVPATSNLANEILRQSLRTLRDTPLPSGAISPATAVLHVTSWSLLVGATVTFAVKLARHSPLQGRWWLAGVPALYAALVSTPQFLIGTSFLTFRSADNPIETPRQALALWITAAMLLVLAVAYRNKDSQNPYRHHDRESGPAPGFASGCDAAGL